MTDLTDRQREVLTALANLTTRDGMPPTLRELAAELGISSTNGVSDHLRALLRKGYVRAATGRSRGWRLAP
jgi:repressor LexA